MSLKKTQIETLEADLTKANEIIDELKKDKEKLQAEIIKLRKQAKEG